MAVVGDASVVTDVDDVSYGESAVVRGNAFPVEITECRMLSAWWSEA